MLGDGLTWQKLGPLNAFWMDFFKHGEEWGENTSLKHPASHRSHWTLQRVPWAPLLLPRPQTCTGASTPRSLLTGTVVSGWRGRGPEGYDKGAESHGQAEPRAALGPREHPKPRFHLCSKMQGATLSKATPSDASPALGS